MDIARPVRLFVVDAFARARFEGNPAAVCPLDAWLPDAVLRKMASEHNLSETAFFVPERDAFRLRWFTPTAEVELCGHATLAAACVAFERLGFAGPRIEFETLSGTLTVERQGDGYAMDFPAQVPVPCPCPPELAEALGRDDFECLRSGDYWAIFRSAAEVEAAAPRKEALLRLGLRGLGVSAPGGPGSGADFVSRFFAPKFGIDEDPVTGSAHCALGPYWAARLGKKSLRARQVSARGGFLDLLCEGDRVRIGGRAILYSEGLILPG
jgi:PhzF family phenazine biosynthesis protein